MGKLLSQFMPVFNVLSHQWEYLLALVGQLIVKKDLDFAFVSIDSHSKLLPLSC